MYCDPSDILSVVDLSKLQTALGQVDDGVLKQEDIKDKDVEPFIRRATALMNAILGSRYIIPITGKQATEMLRGPCVSLGIAAIYKPAIDYKQTDWVTQDAKDAMALLAAYVHQGDPKTWLSLPAPLIQRVGLPDRNDALKWRVGLVWPDFFNGANPQVQSFSGAILNYL